MTGNNHTIAPVATEQSTIQALQPVAEWRISDAQGNELLLDMLDTQRQELPAQTVLCLFNQQVSRVPFNTALVAGNESLTYAQLENRSDKIAALLLNRYGVQKGDRVGIVADRDLLLIPCILGILKAGAAFVPVDPSYPAARKQTILHDAQLKLLIAGESLIHGVTLDNITVLDLDRIVNEIEKQDIPSTLPQLAGNDLAYIIYTSGSTGTPKGVMIEQASLLNYIHWASKTYFTQQNESFALYSSISFDLTITSIFTALVTGDTIVLYAGEAQEILLEKVLRDNRCSIIKLTPSHLKIIPAFTNLPPRGISKLRTLIVGGEDLETKLAADIYSLYAGAVRIYNEYGPTETTVGCMIYQYTPVDSGISVPIGGPISNTRIYLLDGALQPVPAGSTGTLYVAGCGLARGYWQHDEMTASRFIGDPFMPGEKMYNTGDLAFRLLNGNLVYKGRSDDQVKINGHRIELGEVENSLRLIPGVDEAAVTVTYISGEKFLSAYYVANTAISTDTFRAFLATRLPEYAIPFHYAKLQQMPLTPHGKLDRGKLPSVSINESVFYVAPRNGIEVKLAAIWHDILKTKDTRISINQSFFELGGNSIRCIHLVHNIQQHFSVELSLSDVFDHYTIAAQSQLIRQAGIAEKIIIPQTPDLEYHAASPAQHRLYFQQLLTPAFTGYNIASVHYIAERNETRLQEALRQLALRHESLRTSFHLVNGELVQRINEEPAIKMEFLEENTPMSIEEALDKFIRPFNLNTWPLLRAGLWKDAAGKNVLFFDIHHIIADGLSTNIVVNDFYDLYNGKTLEPLPLRYRDYSTWFNNRINVQEVQKQFWKEQLSGELPRLGLPVLRDVETVDTYSAKTVQFLIEGEEYLHLKKIIQAAGMSDFIYLLTVYYTLMYKVTGNTDMIAGTDVTGRTIPELDRIIGSFVNILPLRVKVDPSFSFEDFLQQVRDIVLEAFRHQEFQFDQMPGLLGKENRSERNHLVEVHFSMYNSFSSESKLHQLLFTTVEPDRELSTHYPLKVEIKDIGNAFIIAFVYNDAIYDAETVELLSAYYRVLLQSSVGNSQQSIAEMEMDA